MDTAKSILDKCFSEYAARPQRDKYFYQELVAATALLHFYFGKILMEWSSFRTERWEPLCDKAKKCYEQCLDFITQHQFLSANIEINCLSELGIIQLYQIERRRELSTLYKATNIELVSSRNKKYSNYSEEDIKLIDKCIETWENVIKIERKIRKEIPEYNLNEAYCLYCARILFEKANSIIPSVSLTYSLHILHDSIFDDDEIRSMVIRSYCEHDLSFKEHIIRNRNQLISKFSNRMGQLERHRLGIYTAKEKNSVTNGVDEFSLLYNILLSNETKNIVTDTKVHQRNSYIELAIERLQLALRQNSKHPGCLLWLGRMLFEIGAIRSIQTYFSASSTVEYTAAAERLVSLMELSNNQSALSKIKMAKCLLGEVYFFSAKTNTGIIADEFYCKAIEVWMDFIGSTKLLRSSSRSIANLSDIERKESEFREDIKQLVALTQEIRANNILIDGEMIKEGALRKNWKERYFTLTAENLCYYDSKKSLKLKKRFSAHQIKSILEVEKINVNKKLMDHPYVLKVLCGRRNLYIAFKSKEERSAWAVVLNYIISSKQNKGAKYSNVGEL
jgi:tetratricopeptide (TPR) repeat protein